MVATGGARKAYQGNIGRDLVGGQDDVEREGNSVGDRLGDIRGRWTRGWRLCDGDGKGPGGRRNPCGFGGSGIHFRLRWGGGSGDWGQGETRESGKSEVEDF